MKEGFWQDVLVAVVAGLILLAVGGLASLLVRHGLLARLMALPWFVWVVVLLVVVVVVLLALRRHRRRHTAYIGEVGFSSGPGYRTKLPGRYRYGRRDE